MRGRVAHGVWQPESFDRMNIAVIGCGYVADSYADKPLAMTTADARQLVALADAEGLYLGSAPCSLLSDTAQTVWKALKDGAIGRPRLVYAEFDDGFLAPKMTPWHWRNCRGVPW